MSTVEAVYSGSELAPDSEHYPTVAVMVQLAKWSEAKQIPFADLLKALRWDGLLGCWCFSWAGMFVGVETDGHIHT